MANNTFQIKRTSVTGRTPNTSDPSNTQYIAAGELALNMVDSKLYSSNGTVLLNLTPTADVNVNAQYTWTNTHTFQNTITFSSTINGTANNANNLNSKSESNLNVNNALTANNSGYLNTKSEANLNVNNSVTSNSATYINGNTAADLNTYANTKANSAYTNAVSYTDSVILTANGAITGNAATAYSNATTYASNATNISSGTINETRLPYRINQNVTTTNNVTFANITLTGGTVSTLPTNSTDLVNKQYADAIATGVNFHPAVRLTTTQTFDSTTATYYNGPSSNGVGATITDNSPYIALSLDGVTAAYGDRILMKNSSNTVWNGIYTVSNTGSGSYPWILTRSFDYDQVGSGTNEIDQGDLIYVTAGSTLAGTSWVEQANVVTIGTDAITFVQFSSKALYALSEGAGLYWSVGGAYDGSAASTLAVNTSYIATISSNNSSYLGGVAAANYVNTSGNYTVAGNINFTGTNTYHTSTLYIGGQIVIGAAGDIVLTNGSGIQANGVWGSAGQALLTDGTGQDYWGNPAVNVAAQYTWTNTQTFSNTITFSGSILGSTINASSFTTTGVTANATGVYLANTATLVVGNSTVNTVISQGVINTTSVVNAASYTTGATGTGTGGLVANSTIVFLGNNTVNAAINTTSLNIGGNPIANSTGANNAFNLGGTAAANYLTNSGSFTISGVYTYSNTLIINNNKGLNFQTVNASTYVSFIQQSDDNFVMYSTNTAGGQRPVFSIFANSLTSSLSFSTPVTFNANASLSSVVANGSIGSIGQLLTSNGTGLYWSSPGVASVNTAAQFNWTNTQTFTSNISFTGNNISLVNANGSIQFNGAGDTNWRISRNSGALTKTFYTNSSLDIVAGGSNLEGVVFGNASNTYMEVGANGLFTKTQIYVGNTTVNLAINSTSIVGNTVSIGSPNTATFYNYNGQSNPVNNFTSTAYSTFGGYGGNYLAFGQQTNFAQWIQSGFPSVASPVYYNIILNPLGGNVGITNTAPVDKLSVNGTGYFSGNVNSTGTINAASHTTTGVTANATGVFLANTSQLFVGNATVNTSITSSTLKGSNAYANGTAITGGTGSITTLDGFFIDCGVYS